MQSKLLIVHPHTCYDTEYLTRWEIKRLFANTPDECAYALIEKNGDAKHYLGRMPHAAQLHHSYAGEMRASFTAMLLHECATLVLAGHTGNQCHHTAFQMLVEGFEKSGATALTVVLPSFAISCEEYDTGKPFCATVAEHMQHSTEASFPLMLVPFRHCFSNTLSQKALATIAVFEQYISTVLFRATGNYSLHIRVGNEMIGGIIETGRTLTLVIQHAPTD